MARLKEPQKTIVVGAGPVGALAAIYAAKRGDQVQVYELRGDLRDPSTTPLNFTKSINLALSERGINSLRQAKIPGLLDNIFEETISMYGRMIHGKKQGELYQEPQLYDVHGRFLRAADRGGLNRSLLEYLGTLPNVKLFFNHKLTGADFKKKVAWFEQREEPRTDHAQNPTQGPEDSRGTEIEVNFDFMIGADGAHSAVRYHLMKYALMFYQQEYIDTLWCEFHVSPDSAGNFKLPENYLHIWPGKDFMFIAIPSMDKTFTCTLFMPRSRFAEIDADPASLIPFFNEYFPGVVPNLIPSDEVQKQYAENPHLPLISIKCTPYHYDSAVVILGDAAHAMVPFYGQGMNAGLEDVRILFDCLDAHSEPSSHPNLVDHERRAKALEAYTAQRTPDAHSINDLALRNYQEMRADVTSPLYRIRKFIEEKLDQYFPRFGWATQYSRVSFGNTRYSEVEQMSRHQGKVLLGVLGVGLVSVVNLSTWWLVRERNWASIWFRYLAGKVQLFGRRISK